MVTRKGCEELLGCRVLQVLVGVGYKVNAVVTMQGMCIGPPHCVSVLPE